MTWGVDHLSVRFGSAVALDDVSMTITPGLVHAVVGGDGAGKTTLLRVLAGVGVPHTGHVRIPASGRIGYVPPQGGVFGDLSVDENVEFIAQAYRLMSWQSRAVHMLERSGLSEFGGRLANQLSGGERRKLAGAMALLPHPELLVLDEVTTGVDPVSRMDLWRLIGGAAANGAAVVVATSYLDEAERAGWVLLLHAGRVHGRGDPDEIIAAMPGSIADVAAPRDPQTAWRLGAQWRQWEPGGTSSPDSVRLEDAAIVAELIAEGRGR